MTLTAYTDDILAKTAANKRVRIQLPNNERLFLDRRLPFLCVHRRPVEHADKIAEELISTQAAYLILIGGKTGRATTSKLLQPLIDANSSTFGSFLVIEVWEAPEEEHQIQLHAESGEVLPTPLQFRIVVNKQLATSQMVATLSRGLERIRVMRQLASTELVIQDRIAPQNLTPLLSTRAARHIGCHVIGLEVRPVYRDVNTGEVYPALLRAVRRSLARVFNQTFFVFTKTQTRIHLRHYHSLGRRSFVKAVQDADRRLAATESSFDLILQATPTNAEAAWLEFRRRGFEVSPVFQYRPVPVEVSDLKRRLFQVPIERIEDPTLAHLLREKQDELDRRITMLTDIGTDKFLFGSLQVFGGVDEPLVTEAGAILRSLPHRSRTGRPRISHSAEDFARLARKEIEHYRHTDPDFQPSVYVCEDIFSGMLVSQGDLLLGKKLQVRDDRVNALLQHEIGTHLVTRHNGSCQPFRQMALGLAGYDGLQEGLAVLAEYLVGGLLPTRLRLLAGRIIAVKSLLDNAGFIDTFRVLMTEYGFPQRIAYTITMRVFRGGGLTKDASYLRGLIEILQHLSTGGHMEPLLVGKIAADHIPLVEELRIRQVLRPPPLRPRYLDTPQYTERMNAVCTGCSVLQLVKEIGK